MRSWVKALLVSAITLLLVIIFLPSFAKPGLNSLLPWVLQQANLVDIKVDISKVSWHQFKLNTFSFSSPASEESPLETFSLHDLEIHYSPLQILSGQVSSITIEQVKLALAEQKVIIKSEHSKVNTFDLEVIKPVKSTAQDVTSDNKTAAANEITLPSAKELFSLLPTDTLSIKQLKISHPAFQFDSQLKVNRNELDLHSSITLSALNKPLVQQLTFNNQGIFKTKISLKKSSPPIFILQGEWLESINSNHVSTMNLSLQQSADIESWLALINSENNTSQLLAKTAIQAWSQELHLPKIINNAHQVLQHISGKGLLQIKVNDFSILSADKNAPALLTNADLIINSTTNFDHTNSKHQQQKSWQFLIENFDLKGTTHSVDDLAIHLQQQLSQPLTVNCLLSNDADFSCDWLGEIKQSIKAKDLNSEVAINISGDLKDNKQSGTLLNLAHHLDINIKQDNERWPRLHNTTSGDIIFSVQKNVQLAGDNFWHWQLNLPLGLNSKTHYNEALPNALAKGELSPINWQLLPDWQLQGIDSELTQAKALSVLINDITWNEINNKKVSSKNKTFTLNQAKLSCHFDWLKLQYSPQLRNKNTLENLPMQCDWHINNNASQWQKWPLPALELTGLLQLSSLDFKNTKLRAEANITGLNKRLDLTLHAQHDFSGPQKGAAQLYLNNLNLEWDELGLTEMMTLTQAQLLEGTLSAQGWVQWQQYQEDIFDDNSLAWRWQPDIMLRVDDLAGVYNNTTAWDDVDFQMAIRRPFYQSYKLVSQISANSLNPGIAISNILARSTTTIEPDLSKAMIVIEEIHSDVLGGRVKVPLIRFDTSQAINSFGIEVEGLQMSQLAELESESGISASGTLDGVLPIILLPEGPQVPAGSLFARSPGGLIQYNNQVSSALKESDPSVNLAMQVLEDFHYDKLQTDVTYQPNGELILGLQFQGKNPTFFDGQATHLNLNLDYNLLDLLESLRISNDIVQTLENKYQ